MPTPSTVVWDRDPHTAAKHDLLRRYLAAWLPILFSTFPRITYAEGFAGPGVYSQDEPGSPVIALETLHAHRGLVERMAHHRVDLLFVEEHAGRLRRLADELDRAHNRLGRPPPNVQVHPPARGDCVEVLPGLLQATCAWGKPMLVILDSWHGADIPHELIARIAGNPSSEVLITFEPSFLVRFGEKGAPAAAGNRAFGSTAWQDVFDQPSEAKLRYLVQQYRTAVEVAGFEYTLGFEMVDEGGRQLHLIFATNNDLGVEKMKDAMWAVDPSYGVRYRDPRDPGQMTLDIEEEPDTAPLSRMLLDELAGATQTLDALREFTRRRTVYRHQQVRRVVQRLITDEHVVRTPGTGHLSGESLLALGRPHTAGTPLPIQDGLF